MLALVWQQQARRYPVDHISAHLQGTEAVPSAVHTAPLRAALPRVIQLQLPASRRRIVADWSWPATPQVGDYVDIKVNAAVHKGMPFKFYHGRTGIVWNVTKRALGVELNKVVSSRPDAAHTLPSPAVSCPTRR